MGVSVGSGEHKMGYQLFRKPRLPSPQPLLYVPYFPIPTQENGGWGRGKEGGLTFFVTRQFLRFRRNAETITGIDQWLGKHSDKNSPDGRCPASLCPSLTWRATSQSHWTSRHMAQFQVMELPAILHKVQTARASVCGPSAAAKLCTARGGAAWRARSHSHTHSHALTGATTHRNTEVTTSIHTSHYEYCFQREATHGIKTSTKVTPLARTKKLEMRRGGGVGCHDCAWGIHWLSMGRPRSSSTRRATSIVSSRSKSPSLSRTGSGLGRKRGQGEGRERPETNKEQQRPPCAPPGERLRLPVPLAQVWRATSKANWTLGQSCLPDGWTQWLRLKYPAYPASTLAARTYLNSIWFLHRARKISTLEEQSRWYCPTLFDTTNACGQISPSHLGTCLSPPGLDGLRPRPALVSLPISLLGTQPEAGCPVPPPGAPWEYNLLLWVHVIVSLGAHGWGGSLVHVGGAASRRVCRGAHKPVGGSRALAGGSGVGALLCLSQVWKDNGHWAWGSGCGSWALGSSPLVTRAQFPPQGWARCVCVWGGREQEGRQWG